MTPHEAVESLGLSLRAEFVPFSKSRNAKPGTVALSDMSLNWRVTLVCNGRGILTTDYQQGVGYCPSYNFKEYRIRGGFNIDGDRVIRRECETGRNWSDKRPALERPKIPAPKIEDVLYSLVMDSDVLDYGTFEDWAGACGYNPDSRQAESVYRACLDLALKLRSGIGEGGLSVLREAFQDY